MPSIVEQVGSFELALVLEQLVVIGPKFALLVSFHRSLVCKVCVFVKTQRKVFEYELDFTFVGSCELF